MREASLRISYKAGMCGARVLSIKDLNIETPTYNKEELCEFLKCTEARDKCEAAIRILQGYDVLFGPSEIEEVTKIARALIPIGRFFQYVDFVCRLDQRGLEELRKLKLKCPDYSYPRALFVSDSLSPSVHFLLEALERTKPIEGERGEANCNLKVPKSLVYAYPFSQLECPEEMPEDLKELLKDYM